MTINGKKMTIVRTNKGVSRQELANRSGVSLTTISNYETGKTKDASMKTLRSIATALDVTPEEFEDTEKLGNDVLAGRTSSIHNRFVNKQRHMTPFETQKLIEKYRNGDDSIVKSEAKRALSSTNQSSYGNKTYAIVLPLPIRLHTFYFLRK